MTQHRPNEEHAVPPAAGHFGEICAHRPRAQGGIPDPALFEIRFVENCVRKSPRENAPESGNGSDLVA